ncbi:hypothetical protein Tco_0362316, partial [Tanacetum coccineum]
NKDQLEDFEEFNGGSITFGGSKGYISGTSEVTNNTAVKIPEEKDESRTSSTNSKKEETLTEPQKDKKDSSTDSLEDNPKIQAFRRELEEIALKHLGTVPENNSTSTPSVNTGSQTVTEPIGHTFEEPSPAHQHFLPLQEQAQGQMTVDDLLQVVPQLMSRIDSLETDLKQ